MFSNTSRKLLNLDGSKIKFTFSQVYSLSSVQLTMVSLIISMQIFIIQIFQRCKMSQNIILFFYKLNVKIVNTDWLTENTHSKPMGLEA